MFFLILFFYCLMIQPIKAYQITVPTAIYVENTYTLKPIIAAELTIKQKEIDGRYYTYGTYKTDSLGTVSVSLNRNKTYTVITQKQNFYTQIVVFSTRDLSRTNKNRFGLSMRPKDCYRIKGKVYTDIELTGSDYFILEDIVSKETEMVAINAEGYYFACGDCGKTYSITPFIGDEEQKKDTVTLLEQYCQDKRNPLLKFNINTDKAVPLVQEENKKEGIYAKGDSMVLENLVFEGKTRELNNEGGAALDLLYQNLLNNPKLIVELYVHTDARKSERYNWLLAKRRGNFINEFLSEKGIRTERFTIFPVGEAQISNHCTNGKKCSKAEHAINNRVEMKVIQGDKDFLNVTDN